MTAPTEPAAHDEIDFLDEVERELIRLTTARLEEERLASTVFLPLTHPVPVAFKTVMPANAGTHAEVDTTTVGNVIATQPGYESRRAPRVIPANGRSNKYHGSA